MTSLTLLETVTDRAAPVTAIRRIHRSMATSRSLPTSALLVVTLSGAGLSLPVVMLSAQTAGGPTVSSRSPDAQPKPNAWSPIDNDRVHVTAIVAPPAMAGPLPQVRVWLDGHVQ